MADLWNQVLKFAETTTFRVGNQLLKDFGNVKADEKADGSLVTKSDRWADRTIREAIASTFPSHGILTEESQQIFPSNEWCWIIDPLDGTTNFTKGVPIWGTSMGLFYRGTPMFGYVNLPPLRQSYYGFYYQENQTYLNNPPITRAFLNNRQINPIQDIISGNHLFNLCSRSTKILPQLPTKIRMLGMASYNFLLVASGASIGGVEATPKIWDIAGSWVIAKAAGAIWIPLGSGDIFPLKIGKDYLNYPFPALVVGNEKLVPYFLPIVEPLRK
ncbi:MAG: inositol monophosphatase family protein [Trichodesmium sp. St18_bin1]|jgi:Archaeal fructose-1,6-bisphosphatase and related enzymes of inositol monophosphatase family|nr:inositol monophosphatase family protein [Trichodesmium sp. St18_bin1]MDE5122153.1 inositol monophosphatase family protein [Trichodesmium sp. St19_bin1]